MMTAAGKRNEKKDHFLPTPFFFCFFSKLKKARLDIDRNKPGNELFFRNTKKWQLRAAQLGNGSYLDNDDPEVIRCQFVR